MNACGGFRSERHLAESRMPVVSYMNALKLFLGVLVRGTKN